MKNIAVLGANSMVGGELIKILEQRNYPVADVYFMCTGEEHANSVVFRDKEIGLLSDYDLFLNKVDIVFCCLDKVRTRAAVSKFSNKVVFIDISGAFGFASDVIQVIPEVNPDLVTGQESLIANPNPMTIQLLVAVYPLHKKFRLRDLHVTTLNAVSNLAREACDELKYEYEYLAVGEDIIKARNSVFPFNIGSNTIPQVGDFVRHGDTEGEALLAAEVQRILRTDGIHLGVTALWVPIMRGNSMVVYAGFEESMKPKDARTVLKHSAGVKLMEPDEEYPMPETVVGKDEVYVGRLRQDKIFDNGLVMWIAADNLRKGSALNAVQIAELLR
jgi:aspartate-semialdehyde dehydrogenase